MFLAIDAYIQFFTGYNLLGAKTQNISRISSFFNDELILGSFICKISPLVISFFFIDEIKIKKVYIFLFTFLILNLFTIIISGEISIIFIFFVVWIIIFIFKN